MKLLAIDPGEKYCGVALFTYDLNDILAVLTATWDPETLYRKLEHAVLLDRVVLERYVIYPWALKQHGFASVPTIEVIGVVKHLCKKTGLPITLQNASIKKQAEGMLRLGGLEVLGSTRHERDAYLHGMFWLQKEAKLTWVK
jgi:hypothetical protein